MHYQIIRRIFIGALALLVLSLHTPSGAQELSAASKAAWSQKLQNLIPGSIEGTRTIQDLAALPPDDVYTLISENWKSLSNADIKQYVLSCIVQNDDARVLDILQLGITDNSILVQGKALQFAESFGFDTFTEDFATYQTWRQKMEGKPLGVVMTESMKAVIASLKTADEERRGSLLNILVRTNLTATSQTSRLRRAAAVNADLADALVPWLKQQNNYMWAAYQIIRNLRPDEQFMKREIMPLTDPKVDTSVRYQAFSVLGSEQNIWAVQPLIKMMIAEYPDAPAEIIGQSLVQIGDPHVIPTLIALMNGDNTPEGNRALTNILSPLTGVSNAYVRDAPWWKSWWNKNNGRFGPDLRGAAIPHLLVRARLAAPMNGNPALDQTRPVLKQVADDARKSYWFIDPRPAGMRLGDLTGRKQVQIRPLIASANLRLGNEAGVQPPAPPIRDAAKPPVSADPGLLVVLAPDGDAASGAAFWHDVAINSLERNYCIAVVQAPRWNVAQSPVWLTEADLKTNKDAKFSVETLVADVVKDVATSKKIDPNRIFLHGAVGSGMAAYSCALQEKTPFRAFYILATSFKSANLPPLERAAGRKILIQNSKDDRTHPYWMAEAAQKLLTQKGARARLDSTSGYIGDMKLEVAGAQVKLALDWMASEK